jgi:membrane fusion protein (multidrug efflux system)
MKWLLIAGIFVCLAGSVLVSSCGGKAKGDESKQEPQEVLINVKTRQVSSQSLAEVVVLMGNTLADKSVTLSAETAGRLECLAVDLGDHVRRGTLLARVDYEMLRAQRDQAKANWELAVKNHKRLAVLRADDLTSIQQLDEVAAQEKSAQTALRIAEIQLKKSTIRSPVSGIVARKLVEEGEYVNPGQALVQVADYSTIVISARVPESRVSDIKRGMPVSVSIDSLGESLEGQVHIVVPASDPTSRTFELRVKVPNPEHKILIGMAATLHITLKVHENVVVVPADVVIQSDGQNVVFVEKDGVAKRRVVQLGADEGSRVMIGKGLAMGEWVITEGHRDLVDDQKIRVLKSKAITAHAVVPIPSDPS